YIFLECRPLPRSTLFPYTTLFRSWLSFTTSAAEAGNFVVFCSESAGCVTGEGAAVVITGAGVFTSAGTALEPSARAEASGSESRSEEHTSELQSLAYLVCRLLHEK